MRFFYTPYSIFILLGITFQATALPISTTVDGGYSYGKHLECKAYLHQPEKHNIGNKITLHFFQSGTGVYTTYFDAPWTSSTDYYLTIDKPGILPNPNNPNDPIVDRQLFDYYTTDTLEHCVQNALLWADNYFKNRELTIILGGHSEGSIVTTRVVYDILNDPSEFHLKSQMTALFLSGVVMDNMSDVIAYQLNKIDYDKFMLAYKEHDDNYFYEHYQVGWYWVDTSLKSTYPVKNILNDIATYDTGRSLPIQIFQGLWDQNVPAKSVLTFETNNDKKSENQMLLLYTRYYNAGHDLNTTAITDMQLLLDHYFINQSINYMNNHFAIQINNLHANKISVKVKKTN
jgi:hypothetical protein